MHLCADNQLSLSLSLVLFYRYKLHKMNRRKRERPELRLVPAMINLYIFNSFEARKSNEQTTYKPLAPQWHTVVEIGSAMAMVMDRKTLLLDMQPWVCLFWDRQRLNVFDVELLLLLLVDLVGRTVVRQWFVRLVAKRNETKTIERMSNESNKIKSLFLNLFLCFYVSDVQKCCKQRIITDQTTTSKIQSKNSSLWKTKQKTKTTNCGSISFSSKKQAKEIN